MKKAVPGDFFPGKNVRIDESYSLEKIFLLVFIVNVHRKRVSLLNSSFPDLLVIGP